MGAFGKGFGAGFDTCEALVIAEITFKGLPLIQMQVEDQGVAILQPGDFVADFDLGLENLQLLDLKVETYLIPDVTDFTNYRIRLRYLTGEIVEVRYISGGGNAIRSPQGNLKFPTKTGTVAFGSLDIDEGTLINVKGKFTLTTTVTIPAVVSSAIAQPKLTKVTSTMNITDSNDLFIATAGDAIDPVTTPTVDSLRVKGDVLVTGDNAESAFLKN